MIKKLVLFLVLSIAIFSNENDLKLIESVKANNMEMVKEMLLQDANIYFIDKETRKNSIQLAEINKFEDILLLLRAWENEIAKRGNEVEKIIEKSDELEKKLEFYDKQLDAYEGDIDDYQDKIDRQLKELEKIREYLNMSREH